MQALAIDQLRPGYWYQSDGAETLHRIGKVDLEARTIHSVCGFTEPLFDDETDEDLVLWVISSGIDVKENIGSGMGLCSCCAFNEEWYWPERAGAFRPRPSSTAVLADAPNFP